MIRVAIPRNAEELLELAQKVVAHHNAMGNASPLSIIDMTALENITNAAQLEHVDGETLRKQAELATERERNLLGISKYQNVNTKGTVLHFLTSIRDICLGVYKGEERELGSFGFDVVITSVGRGISDDDESITDNEVDENALSGQGDISIDEEGLDR